MFQRTLNLPKEQSVFLFGPRQVGKTTLIKASYPNAIYYNFLLSEVFNKFSANPGLFREEIQSRTKNQNLIIVDEIQRIPELLNQIHHLMEEDKSLIFVLSGSSARKLKRNQANLLGGRALSLKLFPLTHQELQDEFKLDKALNYGTLPSIYTKEQKEIKKAFLYSYVETYLEEEIKAEALVRNIGSFIRFLKIAAHENGNCLNYSNIARETSNKSAHVKEFFQILEDTLIGFYLLPYNKSQRKRLAKHPKFYFFDTGVQRAITGKLELEIESGTPEYGELFEHFLIKEIIHISNYKKKKYDFSYYRTENNAEVDLIIEDPFGRVIAIEIKSSTRPRRNELKGLKSFQTICPQAELICACRSQETFQYGDVQVLPWQAIFGQLDLS